MSVVDKMKLTVIKKALKMILPMKSKAIGLLWDYLSELPLDKDAGEFRTAILLTVVNDKKDDNKLDLSFAVTALKITPDKNVSFGQTHKQITLSEFVELADDIDKVMKDVEKVSSKATAEQVADVQKIVDQSQEEAEAEVLADSHLLVVEKDQPEDQPEDQGVPVDHSQESISED